MDTNRAGQKTYNPTVSDVKCLFQVEPLILWIDPGHLLKSSPYLKLRLLKWFCLHHSLILSLFLHPRAVTVNTRWTPTDRRPIHSSTTTSVTPPTTTPGAGSRRESPEYRHTTAPSQSLESPNPAPLRLLCPLCHLYPRSPHSSVPLRPRASPRLAVCLDPRAAGLPLHPSRAPTHPVSTAHFIGPQAAWPQAPGPPSLASPPLFDRMKISVHGNSKQRQEISYFLTSIEEWQQTSALVLLCFTYCKLIFICVYFLWSQFFCLGFCFVSLLVCAQRVLLIIKDNHLERHINASVSFVCFDLGFLWRLNKLHDFFIVQTIPFVCFFILFLLVLLFNQVSQKSTTPTLSYECWTKEPKHEKEFKKKTSALGPHQEKHEMVVLTGVFLFLHKWQSTTVISRG